MSDEMLCDRCGNHHGVVWFAPSDIWNAVMRPGYLAGGDIYAFCCPNCFMQVAERELPKHSGWMVIPFNDGPVNRADQITFTCDETERIAELERSIAACREALAWWLSDDFREIGEIEAMAEKHRALLRAGAAAEGDA